MGTAPLGPNRPVNWSGIDVPAIWQRMQREDDTLTLLQVGAWNRTADLLDAHRARLEALLAALAEVWPPTDGSASRAYLEKLRELISSVAQTRDQAAANAYTVDSMMDQLMNARSRIEALNQEYKASRAPAPLNQWARIAMADADKSIYDHGTQLITIDPYRAPFWRAQTTNDSVLGSTSAIDGSTGGGWPARPGTPGRRGDVAESPPEEPILVGGATTVLSPPTTAAPPGNGLPNGGSEIANPVVGTPATRIGSGPVRGTSDGYGQEPARGERINRTRSTIPSRGSEPLSVRSANPGVAGESDTPGHGSLTPGLMAGARRMEKRSHSSGAPYSQWETLDGVPSVLAPEQEPLTHDPGPGVWGIDR